MVVTNLMIFLRTKFLVEFRNAIIRSLSDFPPPGSFMRHQSASFPPSVEGPAHRRHQCVDAAFPICGHMEVICAKAAEPIEMPLGVDSCGP